MEGLIYFGLVFIGFILGYLVLWVRIQKRLQRKELEFTEYRQSKEVELAEYRGKIKSSEDKTTFLEQLKMEVPTLMKAASMDSLKENNKIFLESTKPHMDHLEKSVRENVNGLEKQIRELEEKRIRHYTGIEKGVESLKDVSEKLGKETQNLHSALQKPQSMGSWGEMLLEAIFDILGMQKDHHYYTQIQLDGSGERPDFIVRLPKQSYLLIDAKTSLSSYLEDTENLEETEPGSKKQITQKLLANIQRQMKDLKSKQYLEKIKQNRPSSLSDLQDSPEFIVMFIPNEGAYIDALKEDPSLLERGVRQNILLASPSTILCLLRMVDYLLKFVERSEKIKEITEEGQILCNRVYKVLDYIEGIPKGLQQAQKSYDSAVASMNKMLVPQARKFQKLGSFDKGTETVIRELPSIQGIQNDNGNDEDSFF